MPMEKTPAALLSSKYILIIIVLTTAWLSTYSLVTGAKVARRHQDGHKSMVVDGRESHERQQRSNSNVEANVAIKQYMNKIRKQSADKRKKDEPKKDSKKIECGVSPNHGAMEWEPNYTNEFFKRSTNRSSSKRIREGGLLRAGEFPWLVQVFTTSDTRSGAVVRMCGGTIINEYQVLTASDCFEFFDSYAMVVAGILEKYTPPVDDNSILPSFMQIQTSKTIIKYAENSTVSVNMALIELEKPFKWTERVRPICLPSLVEKDSYINLLIAGWGATNHDYHTSMVYLRAAVILFRDSVEQNRCNASESERSFRICSLPHDICTEGFCGMGEHQACPGDLGGPAMIYDQDLKQWQIYAMISGHVEHCTILGVTHYIRLRHFFQWLKYNAYTREAKEAQLDEYCGLNPMARQAEENFDNDDIKRRRKVATNEFNTNDTTTTTTTVKSTKRIINGRLANYGEVPWYVKYDSGCGGVIIHKRFILTAAHCGSQKYVSAGIYDLDHPDGNRQIREVMEHILHPKANYKDPRNNNRTIDLQLLKLRHPFKWSNYIRPACLPREDLLVEEGKEIQVAGYGVEDYKYKENSAKNSKDDIEWYGRVKRLKVGKIILSYQCNERRKYFTRFCSKPPRRLLPSTFTDGTCYGDSGGPATYKNSDKRTVVYGIIISGHWDCKRCQSNFMAVKVYREWIMRTIQDSLDKEKKSKKIGHGLD